MSFYKVRSKLTSILSMATEPSCETNGTNRSWQTAAVKKFDPHEFIALNPVLALSLICIVGVASVLGTFGNVLILVAVATQRALQRTDAVFVVNLAISDFFVTIIADPLSIVGKVLGWKFFEQYPGLCRSIGSICTVSCVTSLFTITAMSCEKYIYVCHRFSHQRIFSYWKNACYCCCFYLFGSFLVVLNFVGVGDHSFDHKSLECIWDRMANHNYTIVLGLVVIFPIMITGLVFFRLHQHVQRSEKKVRGFKTIPIGETEPGCCDCCAAVHQAKRRWSTDSYLSQGERLTLTMTTATATEWDDETTDQKPFLDIEIETSVDPVILESCVDLSDTTTPAQSVTKEKSMHATSGNQNITATPAEPAGKERDQHVHECQGKRSQQANQPCCTTSSRWQSEPSSFTKSLSLTRNPGEDITQQGQQQDHTPGQMQADPEPSHINSCNSTTLPALDKTVVTPLDGNKRIRNAAVFNENGTAEENTRLIYSNENGRRGGRLTEESSGQDEGESVDAPTEQANRDPGDVKSIKSILFSEPGRERMTPVVFIPLAAEQTKPVRLPRRKNSGSTSCSLFLVYLVFSACWLPFALLIMLDSQDTFSHELHVTIVVWAHLHPSVNWLVYYLTNTKFHAAFRKLLRVDRYYSS